MKHKYSPDNHEPCKPEPHDGQQEITLNGFTFHADKKMIPLLIALNEAGVQTYSHCAGHVKSGSAWVVLELDGVRVEIREKEGRQQMVFQWLPPWLEK